MKFLISLLVLLSLSACAQATVAAPPLAPDEAGDVPSAASALVGSFIRQADGVFGYRMLRPAHWDVMNLVDRRGYTSPGY